MRARPRQDGTEHTPGLLVKDSLERMVGQLARARREKACVYGSRRAPCEKLFLQIEAPPDAARGSRSERANRFVFFEDHGIGVGEPARDAATKPEFAILRLPDRFVEFTNLVDQ